MSHNCSSLLLHCIDFRFGSAIKKYMADNGLMDNCDIVSVAGAAKNLVTPKAEGDRDMVLRQIEISKSLHHIDTVILMNHTDCGAYGGRIAFSSDAEELARHNDDMELSAEIIKEKFPELHVKMVLAKIDEAGAIAFEEKGVFELPAVQA